MAIPPALGIGNPWIFRFPGMSTKWYFPSILVTKGVKIRDNASEMQNMVIIVVIYKTLCLQESRPVRLGVSPLTEYCEMSIFKSKTQIR